MRLRRMSTASSRRAAVCCCARLQASSGHLVEKGYRYFHLPDPPLACQCCHHHRVRYHQHPQHRRFLRGLSLHCYNQGMAILVPPWPGPGLPLTSEHTIGRSASCRLRIKNARVSGHHAVIRWTGSTWEVRDLGSRNGTWISGRRIEPGQKRMLEAGDTLSFGEESSQWRVEDVTSPEPMARTADGTWVSGDDGLLILPDPETAASSVGEEDGFWVAELPDGPHRIEDGDEVEIEGQRYTLFLPRQVDGTREGGSGVLDLNRASMTLQVSQDEEHVELRLVDGEDAIDFPHRAHLYLVLTLARARLSDAADPELNDSEQGWCYQDDMMRQHGIPTVQFNVVLFRARRQLKRAGVIGADQLIERRRGSGQIRLGVSNLAVEAL
ncbi:MAG: hypothetical protein ACI8RZ_002467 [Myxococcota bacterium]|jgi:hypothetical protein